MAAISRTPRVLQVVLSLNPGGTERLVVELARRLHPEIPMAVCCIDEAGSWAGDLEKAGIRVEGLGRPEGFNPGLGRAIARIAAAHNATVVHSHHYSPFVYAALARFWRPFLKVIYTEHGRLSDAPPSLKRKTANALFARLPHSVFSVSRELGEHLVQEGFPSGSVGVIYNGIDVGPLPTEEQRAAVRRCLAVTDGTLVLGTIARLDPVKDLGTLVQATAQLTRGAAVRLVIVGDGSERAALEQQARAFRLEDQVTFLGHRDDARQWLAGCDVYVNSSISEGVSLTILEAMAAGLPIVATRVGGTHEVVDDASGLLIAPRNPAELSAALTKLAHDAQLRARLGAAARRRVEARFTLDRMVREYRDVYARLN